MKANSMRVEFLSLPQQRHRNGLPWGKKIGYLPYTHAIAAHCVLHGAAATLRSSDCAGS